MEELYCQSCGMPLRQESDYGTDADGSPNKTYCVYCWKDGAFTQECTMEEMIDHNLDYLAEFNKDSETQYSCEEARAAMMEFFPHLLRWRGDRA